MHSATNIGREKFIGGEISDLCGFIKVYHPNIINTLNCNRTLTEFKKFKYVNKKRVHYVIINTHSLH